MSNKKAKGKRKYPYYNDNVRPGDGNCFYRTISQFLYGKQDYHIDIRKRLYAYAKNNKDKFKGFILSDENITSEEYIRLG